MKENTKKMLERINSVKIKRWNDIDTFLEDAKKITSNQKEESKEEFNAKIAKGVSFITFDFGIDGVSIEIAKYAECFEKIYNDIPVHVISGDFHDKADIVLKDSWKRCYIEGINGWSKWFGGKTYKKLFENEMPVGPESDSVAVEIWEQVAMFTEKLATYLDDNDISFIVPVNFMTNPGNIALTIATVIVSEYLGLNVLSSNHDFYWEGGAPAHEREVGKVGPRDHFFKNFDKKDFFDLFTKLLPWNGQRWIQVNINTPQTNALTSKFGFAEDRVFELGTSISNKFFEDFTFEDQQNARLRMSYVLSDGNSTISPVNVNNHLENLTHWMNNQHPLVCGFFDNMTLDTTTEKTIYCLQPTRVIYRKRIEMDLQMIEELMKHPNFIDEFENDEEYQLILHITGPVPIEHQNDVETILNAYIHLCKSLPKGVAKRVFIAFSVGTEYHPALEKNNLVPLCIEEIYRLATVILFPSETEGRGLPIIESSAGGVPIICSRYYPEDVFAEVVGENLKDEEQIQYLLFPEGNYSSEFLQNVTELILEQDKFKEMKKHNKKAVHKRYSIEMVKDKFQSLIEVLRTSSTI